METKYDLKLYTLGSHRPKVVARGLSFDECKEAIRKNGIGPFEWYKIWHRNYENSHDIWCISDL